MSNASALRVRTTPWLASISNKDRVRGYGWGLCQRQFVSNRPLKLAHLELEEAPWNGKCSSTYSDMRGVQVMIWQDCEGIWQVMVTESYQPKVHSC